MGEERVHVDQKTICGSCFSSFHYVGPRIKLRFSGSVASAFITEPSHWPCFSFSRNSKEASEMAQWMT